MTVTIQILGTSCTLLSKRESLPISTTETSNMCSSFPTIVVVTTAVAKPSGQHASLVKISTTGGGNGMMGTGEEDSSSLERGRESRTKRERGGWGMGDYFPERRRLMSPP